MASKTKEQAYDELVNPLMAQIIAICKEYKIPTLASFTLDSETGLHCTTALIEDDWGPTEQMMTAAEAIMGSAARKPMVLTTRNAKGEPTAIEVIM